MKTTNETIKSVVAHSTTNKRKRDKMIDAHVHFGSLPQGGTLWGDFKDYRKILN